MSVKIDYYKTIKLLLLALFMYVFYCFSQNGRYQFSSNTQNVVIDTQSGKIYKVYDYYNKVKVIDLDKDSKISETDRKTESVEM